MTATAPALDAHRDPALEQILADHGLTWAMTWVASDDIDWPATNRAQIRSGGTDPDVVDRYAAAIERHDPLPAGFGVDGPAGTRIVGGIHRAKAYQSIGDPAPLYVLPADANPFAVLVASIEHNARHGVPLTNEDRSRHALALVEQHGVTQAEAAAVVGISTISLSKAKISRDGDRRAARRGLTNLWSAFGHTTRYLLASATKDHTDDVFDEVVTTAATADVDTALAKTIAAGIGGKTATEALDWLAEFEAGTHRAATPRASDAAKLRQAAMTICDLDPASVAGGTTTSFAEPTVKLLERAARRIAECAVELRKIERGA